MKKYLALILLVGCGASRQEQEALQTVKNFLQWYGDHYNEVNSFKLVNQGDGSPYSVNFEETEKFLSFLSSSGFVSETYLKSQRTYFKEVGLAYEQNPINEGPPPGFDLDIVLLTQEPERVIEKGKNPVVVSSKIEGDFVTLNLDLEMRLQFKLSKINGSWKIHRIKFFN